MNMEHIQENRTVSRFKVTLLQYVSYRLSVRPGFSLLHRSQKLFLQYIVDIYVRIESQRLTYIRMNQSKLRADLYCNVMDFMIRESNELGVVPGKMVILPSSFIGSPRNMHERYLDAMRIIQVCGKPSLFITFTANPNWDEIKTTIQPENRPEYRPDIVVRVFKLKLNSLIEEIVKGRIFGGVAALVYTIEFQKRGLPHAHILVTLHQDDAIRTPEDIDRFISAEIPDPRKEGHLYALVTSHMTHSCNPMCLQEGKCSKKYPKDFSENTREAINGYPIYRRRNNGREIWKSNNNLIDNRRIVPHNPYLLQRYNAHINVEICSSVKSIKYIYKYIYKGYDAGTLHFTTDSTSVALSHDEINTFITGRYVGAHEAIWRINEFEMHYQSHTIIKLECHLQNQQRIIFNEDQIGNKLVQENVRQSKLLAWFRLNQIDEFAHQYLYTETPLHYTWSNNGRCWQKRKQNSPKVVSRLYAVNPKNSELFHLRMLLLHVRGAKNFEDLRTYDGHVYSTYVDACQARGISANDMIWYQAVAEVCGAKTPKQIRQFFAIICSLNVPNNVDLIWNDFKYHMYEDYIQTMSLENAENCALLEIEEILLENNTTCALIGLPTPSTMAQSADADNNSDTFLDLYSQANAEQKFVIDTIIQAIDTGSSQRLYFLSAAAGCGKTFIQRSLIAKLGSSCIAMAYTVACSHKIRLRS
ncbi:uncharacterized protein LOC116164849 isoform X2 [Photinus pyralis]|uniref:uncharacterized protein LOC116162738 n=1 Tax=Photinus pyralis TaxID=7054 RepID=UPI001266F7DF|nr:uncharacterized protein LOC116162738 [Photinus pyralis]XP_031334939.1 uncharacterized protein LOC116164849 isoform X2 [Photinus pyralis]